MLQWIFHPLRTLQTFLRVRDRLLEIKLASSQPCIAASARWPEGARARIG
jgi:hypothetical protein